ncbi:MAG: hypothetical protein SH808_04515 [Saprospiraceae bacterium]|nr:hypothetical protein [Saprospiraceae bacterium]
MLRESKLTDDLIYQSAQKGDQLYNSIDVTLKGKEISQPTGYIFKDKDGAVRPKSELSGGKILHNACIVISLLNIFRIFLT